MSFLSSIGNTFRSIGNKVIQGSKYIGQKTAQGLDYTIQGLKTGTDLLDKYTLGLDHFIPYYSLIKSGIDVSDHVRKMIKGEERFNFSTATDIGLDLVSGAFSAYGGKAELEGLKGGMRMFKTARRTGSSLAEATKIAGGRALRGYGLHKEQLKELGREGLSGTANLAKAVRKGNPRAIAKLSAIGGGITGGVELKQQIDKEQENMRRTQTQKTPVPTQQKVQPRILQKPSPPVRQSPPQSAPPLLSIPGLDKRFKFIRSDR